MCLILSIMRTSFHYGYSQRDIFLLCYLMARSRDAGPKRKSEIYYRGCFLKDTYFYSPSVTLVRSQYPAVSFITALGLMEY